MSSWRSIAWMTAVLVCGLAATAWAAGTTVPDVVGLQIDQAKALMAQAGFETSVTPVQGHPIGRVVSQEPGGLAPRSKGSTIVLKVGAPTPKPGMGTPTTRPTPRDDLGAPPAGSGTQPDRPGTPTRSLPRARSSTALVWRGRAIPEGRMPDTNGPEIPAVLGQTEPQARRALSGWNINVEQTMAVPNLVGKVVNQMPFAGTRLSTRETVTIIVAVAKSPSPNHVFVPQAHGKPWIEGLRSIEDGGLQPMPRSVASSPADRGRILAQMPHTGSLAPRGSAVVVLVGRGPGAYSAETGAVEPMQPTPMQPSTPPAQPEPVKPTPAEPEDDTPPAGTTPSPLPTEPPPTEPTRPPPTEPTQPPPTEPTQPPPTEPTPTEPTPPAPSLGAPSLSTPPGGESYPYKYGADFAWTAISGADGYELELQEEQPSGAWTKVETYKTVAPKYRPTKIDRGRYRWRVRAVAGDTQGPWSEFRRLYMY